MAKRYFLRLFSNGGWELYDSGHIVCAGRRWNASLASHIYRLMRSREGIDFPVSEPPSTGTEPTDIDTFLKRMAAI